MRDQKIMKMRLLIFACFFGALGLVGCDTAGPHTLVDRRDAAPVGVKVGQPYTIAGTTYRPAYRTAYSEEGIASWYGPGFHGKPTANGERFDARAMTAAHPTLQLPSYVQVTNLDNGRQVVLRVNDRGPFAKGRVIDVSAAAAEQLGFKTAGTARVRVDLLPGGPRPPPTDMRLAQAGDAPVPAPVPEVGQDVGVAPAPAPKPMRLASAPIAVGQPIFVQVGAFSVESNARALAARLGPDAAVAADAELWRVYLGPYASRSEAEAARATLRATGHGPGMVVESL
jgi:rare lipoprotein A